jgi:uncharacterized protein YjeT (DUF2065 family)
MIKPKNKYRAFGYFAMAIFYYVLFAGYLLTGGTPRGDYQKATDYYWTYISILFLLFLYQAVRGIYLYWTRLRRDTDPLPEVKSFSPRTASLITSFITIPIGLCFLILPIVELVKKTAYGGNIFGNHPLTSEPDSFWILLIFQCVIAFVPIIGGILLFIFPPKHIEAVAEIVQLKPIGNARPRMKTSTKIIIGSVITVFLSGCLVVAGIVGFLTYSIKEIESPERTEKRNKAKIAGLEFAKTTDQNGCMEKGYSLETVSDRFDLSNEAFDESCLNASRPTPNFCEGVPLLFKRDWVNEQCKKVGHDTTSCYQAFAEKIDFCRTDGKKLNP